MTDYGIRGPDMLSVGTILDGKYKIMGEIGRGGMSVVYLAINEKANKTWAVKEVRKHSGYRNEIMEQSLIAEIEMLKKLNHPHLPSIVDVIDRQDSFLIVMDYIEGQSLQSVLKQEGPQDAEQVILWAQELCDVLLYLHSRRPAIIYRDMKPANIILRPDGHVTLVDFGTAREYKEQRQEDTTWLGTRGYAAPEQFGGCGQTDERTDIYSLGATLYHLLTGKSPADTQFVIYPVSRFRPELRGSGLEKVVAKCCRPDPGERYQSCRNLMFALTHIHDQDDAVRKKRRKRWRIFLAGVCVTLAGAAGTIGFSALKLNIVAHSYATYLSQAENTGGSAEAAAYFKKAIALQPGNVNAYEEMLDDMACDGMITQKEKILMDDAFNELCLSHQGTLSNLEYLRFVNPKGYAAFSFHLGCDYYMFYQNGQRDANQILKRIMDDDNLNERNQKIARSLTAITDYYVHAAYRQEEGLTAVPDAAGGYSYQALWEMLWDLVADPEMADEKTGGHLYSLSLYREIAAQISMNLGNFQAEGITQSQMEEALAAAADYRQLFSEKNETAAANALQEETDQAVMNAENEVTAYFRTIGGDLP